MMANTTEICTTDIPKSTDMVITKTSLTAISLHADIEIPVPSICFKA